jgi:hypothetical protein
MGAGNRLRWRRARGLGMAVTLVVSPFLLPSHAEAARSNLGGGAVHGSVVFAPPGIPPAGQPCVPVSFTVNATAPTFVLNTVITGYAGLITITGSGATDCTSTTVSGGTLALTVTGEGPTGSRVDCQLAGGFTRLAVEIVVQLTGPCVVNQYGTGPVQFLSNLLFTPLPPGAGVTQPVLTANFDGAFVVVPAQS